MSDRAFRWIGREHALALHAKMVAQYGGSEGLRDESALLAALERVRNLHACGEPPPDVADLAAGYAGGVVLNHPFVDGNKRVGFMMAYAFIRINGHDFTAPEVEAAVWTLKFAARACTEADCAAWLRRHTAAKADVTRPAAQTSAKPVAAKPAARKTPAKRKGKSA
jgi:death-on-curing protein